MTDQISLSTAEAVLSNAAGPRHRSVALIVLCTGMLMMVLDATIVNVTLPAIQKDLGFSQSSLAWVVNSYLIAYGGLLLLAGRFGDFVGRRAVFLFGLVLFCVASLLCGISTSPAMLVASRFLQGSGSALTSSVILGMIVTMYPEAREKARAIGVFSFVASAGGSLGMVAGGVLTQTLSWHWVFFVNLPIGAVTVLAALRFVPRERGLGFGGGVDVLGAFLITSAVMLAVFTIVSPATQRGWTDSLTLSLGGGVVGLFGMFWLREVTAQNPMVPLRIFAQPQVAAANVIQAFTVSGVFGIFFIQVLFFQKALGYDALQIGLAFFPCSLVIAIFSFRFTGQLAARFGARRILFVGLTTLIAGELMFALLDNSTSYPSAFLPSLVVIGAGIGLTNPSVTVLAMSSADPDDAGLTSGLVNTTLQVGAAIGLAVLASISTAHTKSLLSAGHAPPLALLAGFHVALLVGAGLISMAFITACVAVRNPGKESVAA